MNLIELNHALRQLRLGGMASVLETRLHQAQVEAMAPIDLISCLISDELTRRSDRLLERRTKQAGFRDPHKTLDNFDFNFNTKMNRSLVFDLANDVTITPANPASPRTLTIPDPGNNDTFAFLAAAQTLTNKTLTSPTIQGAVGGGTGLTMPAYTAGGNITGGSDFTLTTSVGNLILNAAGSVTTGVGFTFNNVGNDEKFRTARTGGNVFSWQHDASHMYIYNNTASRVDLKITNAGTITIAASGKSVGFFGTAPLESRPPGPTSPTTRQRAGPTTR